MKQDLERSVPYYGREAAFTRAWDEVHRRFNCCGSNSSDDFPRIPASCRDADAGVNETSGAEADATSDDADRCCVALGGCRTPVSAFMRAKSAGLGNAFLLSSLLWLTIALIAGCIACSLKLQMRLQAKAKRRTCAPVPTDLHGTQSRRF